MAINAAAADPRIKSTVASTMYDMSRVSANGYFDADDNAETRNALRKTLAAQRTEDFRNGFPKPGGGVPDELPADAPQYFKDYHAYYKTPRGYHPRSLNSNQGRNATEAISFINFPLMSRADEIESAVLIIHVEKAHSRYFGEDAFKKLSLQKTGIPREQSFTDPCELSRHEARLRTQFAAARHSVYRPLSVAPERTPSLRRYD